MKSKRVVLVCMLFLILLLVSCMEKKEETSKVKLYYNKNSIVTIKNVETLVKEYKNKEGKEIEIVPLEDIDEMKSKIGEHKESAIVLLDGYSFMDFTSKNYLRDLTSLFKDKTIRERFSLITNLYSRINGRYFGLAFKPYSLELIYNKEMLKEMQINVTENNMFNLIKKLNEKNIKIPTYIESRHSKEILLSNLVANDTIVYDIKSDILSTNIEEKIKEIKSGQILMDKIYYYYNEGILREDNFIDRDENVIKELNESKIPVLLTTSLITDRLNKESGNFYCVNKLPINNNVNSPVGSDLIICSTIGSSNSEDIDIFMRYLIQSDVFKKLSEKNLITGNKDADSNLLGVSAEMAENIHAADGINKFYINIISDEKIKKIENEIKNIMSGKYDKKEWDRVLE